MPTLIPLSQLFVGYAALVVLAVAAALLATFRGRSALLALAGLGLWLSYAVWFSRTGLLRDTTLRPPAILLLLAPILGTLVLVIGRSRAGALMAARLPVALPIGFQVFRVGVELVITRLHDAGLAPHLMTLEGGNVEVLFALGAPIVAVIVALRPRSRSIALAWNALGIVSLLNVASRAVMSAPGPLNLLHTEVPNIGFGIFPFGLIPGFTAPLAIATHMLTFRALRRAAQRGDPESATDSPAAMRTVGDRTGTVEPGGVRTG